MAKGYRCAIGVNDLAGIVADAPPGGWAVPSVETVQILAGRPRAFTERAAADRRIVRGGVVARASASRLTAAEPGPTKAPEMLSGVSIQS